MLTYNAKFPINYFLDGEDSITEPFSYSVRRYTTDDGSFYRAMCHDIPCDICEFLIPCNRSEHRNSVFANFCKEKFPELDI